MKITLLRHATRDFVLGDVALNQKGTTQALELSQQTTFKDVTKILSSPKLRAKLTVAPLANVLKLDVQIDSSLDQMEPGESNLSFKNRIQSVINNIPNSAKDSHLLICTHSDWLDCAMKLIPTDELHLDHSIFQCADYLSFEITQGLWKLKRNNI